MKEKIIGRVFNVRRIPKSTKSVDVGDFKTLQEAEEAMLDHYARTPKRGNFKYTISEEEIYEVEDYLYRKCTFNLYAEGGSFYKSYAGDELKARTSRTC